MFTKLLEMQPDAGFSIPGPFAATNRQHISAWSYCIDSSQGPSVQVSRLAANIMKGLHSDFINPVHIVAGVQNQKGLEAYPLAITAINHHSFRIV